MGGCMRVCVCLYAIRIAIDKYTNRNENTFFMILNLFTMALSMIDRPSRQKFKNDTEDTNN